MNRQDKATLYAKQSAEQWESRNKYRASIGEAEYDLEWIIRHTWIKGFDAGQLHQRKINKAKKAQP